jgi:hypothetical protein
MTQRHAVVALIGLYELSELFGHWLESIDVLEPILWLYDFLKGSAVMRSTVKKYRSVKHLPPFQTPIIFVSSGMTEYGGTIAPAATVTLLPIFTRSQMVELAPMKQASPVSTLPAIVAPGPTELYAPMWHRVILAW